MERKNNLPQWEEGNEINTMLEFMESMKDFKELMMMYTCAMKEIKTKFEVLDTEFNVKNQHNPISSVSTRLKSPASIVEKLKKNNFPLTVDSIKENLHDVAGVRVICYYIDDIYTIADALLRQDDIESVQVKDYIKNPKPNGYRSLHLIVKIPVFFADCKEYITAEVQIRTIAMDFWASLEHQLKYKKEVRGHEEIAAQLKECAESINSNDEMMQKIRSRIEAANVSDA